MMFAHALWWLALPVLVLPIWWHRQKRRRTQAEPLATARFLPSAPPRQMRVWRWDDVPLLLLRCLLLVALIAWLAVVALPWRGDTIVIAGNAPSEWVGQQAAQAGMAGAQRLALPASEPVLPWLQRHEHEWRRDAKLLVLARSVALPAQLPKLAHAVDIRMAPVAAAVRQGGALAATTESPAQVVQAAGATKATQAAGVTQATQAAVGAQATQAAGAAGAARAEQAEQAEQAAGIAQATQAAQGSVAQTPAAYPVALVTTPERKAAWHALFAAFDAAGGGQVRHAVTEFDGSAAPPAAALVIWDRTAPPPANWNAPLWWLPSLALPLFPGVDRAAVQALRLNNMPLQVADSPRGRLWASGAWPPNDADSAKALYDTWHALHFQPQAWPLQPQVLPAQRTTPLPMADSLPDAWLAYALLALFILERLMTHVRRR